MLQLDIPAIDLWNESTGEFLSIKSCRLTLEHSLVSVSKWESKWNKPFLTNEEKTPAEFSDYIRCMTITQNVNPIVYNNLTSDVLAQVIEYMGAPMTATWFRDDKQPKTNRRGQTLTSELVYYYMIELGIPFECQKWHLNRLFTLIKVCTEERKVQKVPSVRERLTTQAALNSARRAKYHTRG